MKTRKEADADLALLEALLRSSGWKGEFIDCTPKEEDDNRKVQPKRRRKNSSKQ